jgi:parvulin-like peptidyl-prolyl isomerase
VLLKPTDLLHRIHQRGRLLPLLREAAAEEVCVRAARDAGLSVPDDELQRAADDFRQRRGLQSAAAARSWLADRQLTSTDLEEALERDLLVAKLKDHLFAQHGPARFAADRPMYERVHLRRLTALSEGAARELLLCINDEGADLAELVREHGLDATSRATAGDLGVLSRRQLPASVATAVFAAREGDVVGPLADAQGFHLYRVEARLPAELDGATAEHVRRDVFTDWLRIQTAGLQFDLGSLQGPHEPR